MGRAADEDERVYGAAAALSAAETVAAMSTLASDNIGYNPTDPPDVLSDEPYDSAQHFPHHTQQQQYQHGSVEGADNFEQPYGQEGYNYYNDGCVAVCVFCVHAFEAFWFIQRVIHAS